MTSLKKARGMRDIGNQGNGVNVPLEVFDLMAQAYEAHVKELEDKVIEYGQTIDKYVLRTSDNYSKIATMSGRLKELEEENQEIRDLWEQDRTGIHSYKDI